MNLLIRNAALYDPQSSFHKKTVSVLIQNGIIKQIAENIDVKAPEADGNGAWLMPGFFDLNINAGEPGLETREDLDSAEKAAAAGGFTGVAVMPNTQPPVHARAEVEYLMKRAQGRLVDFYPLGTISQKREGKDLSEMFDMQRAGAIAFTDGNRPVQDAGLMMRALQYAKGLDALVFSFAEDEAIAGGAQVHEGEVSTMLGMKGIPGMAEELMIARDLYLAEYTGSRIHFSTISTARSVDLIRQAKKRGISVTCDVAAYHLVLNDDSLAGFDSLYKTKPPLRTKSDSKALVAGLRDGTIDAVVSQHTPYEVEHKDVEFQVASYGMTGLQTVFSLVKKAGLNADMILQKLCIGPRQVLGLPVPQIAEGQPANLTLVAPSAEWTFSRENNRSLSVNSPFIGQSLSGKVLLTIHHNQITQNP
ncbi:MAG: dihydroorotase [Mucilaginibacter polytrichastri]|nr:dihydroorotase [Mucilaginibacter polytrichastri]